MKYFTHTNAGKLKLNFRTKMNLLTTGLIFVLLLLSRSESEAESVRTVVRH